MEIKTFVVNKCEKKDGCVSVWFGNNKHHRSDYCASLICEIGEPADAGGKDTMWGWTNHLRSKIYWTDATEKEFQDICKRFLKK